MELHEQILIGLASSVTHRLVLVFDAAGDGDRLRFLEVFLDFSDSPAAMASRSSTERHS